MDELDLPQAVLVGHSMGGMVAQEIAAIAPPRVAALVLACTSPAFGRPERRLAGAFRARRGWRRWTPGLRHGRTGRRAGAGDGGARPPTPPAPRWRTRVMAAVPEATYRRVLAAIVAFDRRAALPAIGVPTLCLAGEADRTAPPEVLRAHGRAHPGCRASPRWPVPATSPTSSSQRPSDAVLDFLRRHPCSARETCP